MPKSQEEMWICQGFKKCHTSGWLFAGKASKGGQWYVGHKLGRIHDHDLSRLLWQGGHNNRNWISALFYISFSISLITSRRAWRRSECGLSWFLSSWVTRRGKSRRTPWFRWSNRCLLIIVIWKESYDIQQTPWYMNWTLDISRGGLNHYEN